jgi:hypothetical protein
MKYVISGTSNDRKGLIDNELTCVTKLVCTDHTPLVSGEDEKVPGLLHTIQKKVIQHWAKVVGAFDAYDQQDWVLLITGDTDVIFEGTTSGNILYIPIETSPDPKIIKTSARGARQRARARERNYRHASPSDHARWVQNGGITDITERVAGVTGTIESLPIDNKNVKVRDVTPWQIDSFSTVRDEYDTYMLKNPNLVLCIHHLLNVSSRMRKSAFEHYYRRETIKVELIHNLYKIHRIFEDAFKNRNPMSIVCTSDVTELHRLLEDRWSEDMTAAFETEHIRIIEEQKSIPPDAEYVEDTDSDPDPYELAM